MSDNAVLRSSLASNQSKIQSSLFVANPILKSYGTVRAPAQTVRMSHFTSITTKLTDKKILEKSLKELNVPLSVANKGELIEVRGHRGEKTQAEFMIRQENGYDFGFVNNGQTYELVADVAFWQQGVPVEVFLEKLTQRYSLNTILDHAEEKGFATSQVKTNVDATVEVTLEQWVPEKQLVTSYIALDQVAALPQAQTAMKLNRVENANGAPFKTFFNQNMSNLTSQGAKRPLNRQRAGTVAAPSLPFVQGSMIENIDSHMDSEFSA